MKKRDSIVAKIANVFILTFASDEYNEQLIKVIRVGQSALDAAVIQERLTPKQPYAIQIGFNGYEAIKTVAPSSPKESDEKK